MATHVSQQSGIMPGISERDDFEPSDAGIYVEGLHVSYGARQRFTMCRSASNPGVYADWWA
jgi:hypothetical protein